VLSVPVFTTDETRNRGNQDPEYDNPHCVFHLINKLPTYSGDETAAEEDGRKLSELEKETMRMSQKFTFEEIRKAEKLALAIGRCAE
jgi:hypothetical protein